MADAERTTTVPVSIDKAWAFMSDFTNSEQWDPPTVRCVRTSGDGGVGTVYHTTTKMMGSESEIDYTVEESHAPTRFVLRGNNETLTSLDTISLSGDEGTTTLTYHADFELKGAAKLGTPALPLVLKKLGDDVIEQIEDCLRAL